MICFNMCCATGDFNRPTVSSETCFVPDRGEVCPPPCNCLSRRQLSGRFRMLDYEKPVEDREIGLGHCVSISR
jgi:hypothetical protein